MSTQIADSTRVVKYDPSANSLLVEWSDGEFGTNFLPQVGDRFLINGRPFNGMGAGYRHVAPNYSLDETVDLVPDHPLLAAGTVPPLPTALLPNYGYYEGNPIPNTSPQEFTQP